MNTLKFIVLFGIVFLSYTQVSAQVVLKKDTAKATINNSEKQAKEVKHDGVTYHIIDGIWYTKLKNRLVLRQAPKGARITFLPKNGKEVTMGGKKYYRCKGVFYKKETKGYYQVVRL